MDEKILSKYINSATVKAYLQESLAAGLRSEEMADSVEFSVDVREKATPPEKEKTNPRSEWKKGEPAVSYVKLF